MPRIGLLLAITLPAARNGRPHGGVIADYKKGVRLWLHATEKG
jgi:hypothetical protein